jgi:2-haloacid dehalogenase
MPGWITFDLNGTLVDPADLLPQHDREVGRGALDDAVTLMMAETVIGAYTPLPEHLRATLERRLLRAGEDPRLAENAMSRAQSLAPMQGAGLALEQLADAGFRLAVVTNSSADSARAILRSNDLDAHFEAVIGTETVRAYKPHQAVYRNAQRELDASPEDLMLVAAHAWDVYGASAAGWRTCWVAERERRLPPSIPRPDLEVQSLEQLPDALTRLTPNR